MDLKVICNCQAKFAFEIEPVNGRMPVTVKCPVCGQDATELANAAIAQKLAASGAAAPRIPASPVATIIGAPVTIPSPAPAPIARPVAIPSTPAPSGAAPQVTVPRMASMAPPPPGSGTALSVSGGAHASATPAPAAETGTTGSVSAIAMCPKHGTEIAVAECFVCQKPICNKCMEQFGYLCSAYCKGQAQARHLKVPVFEGQIFKKAEAEGRSQNRLIFAAVGAMALLLGVYIWYWFIGSRPKTAFRIETGPGTPFMFADWIGDDRFVGVTAARVVMYNSADGTEVWGVDLPKGEIKGDKSKGRDGDGDWYFDFEPTVKIVSKDIWIALPSRVLCLDSSNGKKKKELVLGHRASEFRMTDTHFLAVSRNPTNDSKLLTRINLSNGQMDAQYTPTTSGAKRIIGTVRPMQGLGNTSLKNFTPDDEEFSEYNTTYYGRDPDFVFAGVNVAQMKREVVEERIAVQAATKKKNGPLIIDSGNARASQGIAAAEEFFNSNVPDEKIDYSLYSVTIDRYFGGGQRWTGQVIGRPYFFAQKTVDFLVASTNLIVFNKNNQKIWEAKLTYPIAPQFWGASDDNGPALETSNRLLFYDQGILTAFDLKKGEPQWRVNSVGIKGLALDGQGNVYLDSTTAGPEQIRYSKQVNFAEKIYPMVVKVDLKSGKVLWQSPRVGTDVIVSGSYVYTTDSQVSGVDMMSSMMGSEKGVPTHWRLFRLDPGNGKDQWEYYRKGAPESVRPRQKRILIQSKEELRMLKFL